MNKQKLYKKSILGQIQETLYNLKHRNKRNLNQEKAPHEKNNWYHKLCKKISNFSCHSKHKYETYKE